MTRDLWLLDYGSFGAGWIAVIPIAYKAGWLTSVTFVSAPSDLPCWTRGDPSNSGMTLEALCR